MMSTRMRAGAVAITTGVIIMVNANGMANTGIATKSGNDVTTGKIDTEHPVRTGSGK
jgi:hypothetical protein